LLKTLDIPPAKWQKLLDLPAATLLKAQENLPREQGGLRGGFRGIGNSGTGSFGAVVDGHVIPQHPFAPTAPEISRNKPLLTGWNEDEHIFFAAFGGDTGAFSLSEDELKTRLDREFGQFSVRILDTYRQTSPDSTPSELYIAIRSITLMGLGSIRIAERKTLQGGAPAYLYNFGYKSNARIPGTETEMGAMHAMDIPFKFYNVESGMAGSRPDRFDASRNMTGFWTSFARTGIPAAAGQPDWPAYNLETRPSMRIDVGCEVLYDRLGTEREMWEEVYS
jgi:para-nitrobenzyl esterase